jgi:putative citrate transport
MCATGRDNVRLLRLRPPRRRPRAACRGRIRDFHCCGRRILCRGRRNPFAYPATRLAARKCRVGLLSGVLDNAPAYQFTFLTDALGLDHFDINRLPDVAEFTSGHESRLAAISAAATFFDGLTYIGTSPNLLIRAIAESRHVPAPGFLGYAILLSTLCPSWFRSWRWSVSFSSAADYLRPEACRLTMTLQCLPA